MKFNVMQITSGGRENDQPIGAVHVFVAARFVTDWDQAVEDAKEEAVRKADSAFGKRGYSYVDRVRGHGYSDEEEEVQA